MKRKHSVLSGFSALLLALVMIVGMSSFTFAASKPGTPKIKALTSDEAGSLVVTVGTITNAKGYQVKYSLKSNFSGAKTKTFKGKKLYKKTVSGLKAGKKYYVKVRAYTTNAKGKKVYSSYSKKKPVTVAKYVTGYTKDYILHCKAKKNANAADVAIPYKAEVLVSKSIAPRSKAQWVKMKYNGKVCYKYFQPNETYFTDKPFDKADYTGNSEIRQQVVDLALSILDEKTTYKNTSDFEPGTRDSSGRMQFDCSGFTSYVVNSVMQAYIPNYNVSNGITFQGEGGNDYTKGVLYTDASGKFKTDKFSTGKPDFSKLQPGDFVFFNDNSSTITGKCDHVGIYIGNKEFIHSVKTMDGVCVMPMDSGRYYDRFLFARRFVPDKAPAPINEVRTVKGSANVYSDIKFNDKTGDRLDNGTEVTLLYTTPCSWKNEDCCFIGYGNDSTGYVNGSTLKK